MKDNRKNLEGKNAKGKNFRKLRADENNFRRRCFRRFLRSHFYWILYSTSGYLRNLRGRLLSSEKLSEVFTLWVLTLTPFPGQHGSTFKEASVPLGSCLPRRAGNDTYYNPLCFQEGRRLYGIRLPKAMTCMALEPSALFAQFPTSNSRWQLWFLSPTKLDSF